MFRNAMVVGLLFTASAAAAQSSPKPYKLIVLRDQQGVAVTDYPSLERCEKAIASLKLLVDRQNADKAPRYLDGGGMIIPKLLVLEAFCIPG